MEIKVFCTFEQTFEVPEGIEIDTPEFDDFVIECIGLPEMLTHEVTDSGIIAIKKMIINIGKNTNLKAVYDSRFFLWN